MLALELSLDVEDDHQFLCTRLEKPIATCKTPSTHIPFVLAPRL
jgi:hypothetical protein